MIERFDLSKPHKFPVMPWCVEETAFSAETNYLNETVFSLANGTIGTRGTHEEGYPFPISQGLEGNFINGFYESEPIRYGEFGHGYPAMSQTMLNVANAKIIRLSLDGEPLDLRTGATEAYSRRLQLDEGILYRDFIWTSPAGKRVQVRCERFASLTEHSLLCIRYTVEPLNFSGLLCLVSVLDGAVENHTADTNPLIDYGPYHPVLHTDICRAAGSRLTLLQHTKNSGLSIASVCEHLISGVEASAEAGSTKNTATVSYSAHVSAGQRVTLTKFIVYTASEKGGESPLPGAEALADSFLQTGYSELRRAQTAYVSAFWRTADVQIDGDDALQQAVRFNLFHIMQAAGRDGKTAICAKGLTGEGYEGHYFWDTEMYIMPFFSAADTALARHMLDYRYNTLPQARQRALEIGHSRGAAYVWRTINGEEASAYYPHSTAQYHINGAIFYALRQYLEFSGDEAYLLEKGAEMLFEICRIWLEVGHFCDTRGGKFCISDVTGPDEYTAIVDNNFYTNLLAKECLLYGVQTLERLRREHPAEGAALERRLELEPDEPLLWKKAAENMYFPWCEALGIYGQDDTFLYKKNFDLTRLSDYKLPLMVHYHPLSVYRYRVSKQADLMLGMYLFSDRFTAEEKERHFRYYDSVTLHDSSLSACIFSIMAAELGMMEKAYEYFICTARLDIDDHHDNTHTGIHAANMAGSWLGIVHGFGGMRVCNGVLHLSPKLPKEWNGYAFRLRFQSRLLYVEVCRGKTRVTVEEGQPLEIVLNGQKLFLNGQEARI